MPGLSGQTEQQRTIPPLQVFRKPLRHLKHNLALSLGPALALSPVGYNPERRIESSRTLYGISLVPCALSPAPLLGICSLDPIAVSIAHTIRGGVCGSWNRLSIYKEDCILASHADTAVVPTHGDATFCWDKTNIPQFVRIRSDQLYCTVPNSTCPTNGSVPQCRFELRPARSNREQHVKPPSPDLSSHNLYHNHNRST